MTSRAGGNNERNLYQSTEIYIRTKKKATSASYSRVFNRRCERIYTHWRLVSVERKCSAELQDVHTKILPHPTAECSTAAVNGYRNKLSEETRTVGRRRCLRQQDVHRRWLPSAWQSRARHWPCVEPRSKRAAAKAASPQKPLEARSSSLSW